MDSGSDYHRRSFLYRAGTASTGLAALLLSPSAVTARSRARTAADHTVTIEVSSDADSDYERVSTAIENLSSHTSSSTEDVVVDVAAGTYHPDPMVIEGVSQYSVTVRATGDATLVFDPDSPPREATSCFTIRDVDFDTTPPLDTVPDNARTVSIEGFEFDLRGELVNAIAVAPSAQMVVIRDNTFTKAADAINISGVSVGKGGHLLSLHNNDFRGLAPNIISDTARTLIRRITDNTVTDVASGGVDTDFLLAGVSILEFANNTVDGARINLNLWSTNIDTVHDNTFTGGSVGLRLTSGTIWSFHNNEIRDCETGLQVYEGGIVETIRASTIENATDIGLRIGPSGLIKTVATSTFAHNDTGIELRGGAEYHSRIETFTDNRVRENGTTGIRFGRATRIPVLTKSSFAGNQTHIEFAPVRDTVAAETNYDKMAFSQNVFATDATWAISLLPGYDGSGTLTATDNYWGAPSGPSGGTVDPKTATTADGAGSQIAVPVGTRPIRFDPYLEAAPFDTGPPPVVGADRPTDPDGDGRFEDVNADGAFDVTDIQALYTNQDSDAVQSNPDAFDFNGDGAVSILDVQALFAESLEN